MKPPGVEDWLNALDGIAYLAAPDGAIIATGREAWVSFVNETGGDGPQPVSIVGRSLFEMLDGEDVKAAFLAVHRRVASLARRAISYEYRCDAPGLERLMKMSVSALITQGRLYGVLYQSTLLAAKDRVPLEFLSNSAARREERRQSALPFVRICQFCAKVTMQAWESEWVEPHVFYQRGGRDEVRLTHGVCPECERTRLEPLLSD